MHKILIIGLQGSGKSTFANKLGKALKLEVIHLDKLYYKPGWIAVTKDEWDEILKEIISKNNWIIDGNYTRTLDFRISASDTIIFLNFNKILCIYRAFKRSFDKNQPFDKVTGDRNKLSRGLIKKIITYDKKEVLNKLKLNENTKKIFIAKNREELGEIFKKLTTN